MISADKKANVKQIYKRTGSFASKVNLQILSAQIVSHQREKMLLSIWP